MNIFSGFKDVERYMRKKKTLKNDGGPGGGLSSRGDPPYFPPLIGGAVEHLFGFGNVKTQFRTKGLTNMDGRAGGCPRAAPRPMCLFPTLPS